MIEIIRQSLALRKRVTAPALPDARAWNFRATRSNSRLARHQWRRGRHLPGSAGRSLARLAHSSSASRMRVYSGSPHPKTRARLFVGHPRTAKEKPPFQCASGLVREAPGSSHAEESRGSILETAFG